MLKRLVRLRAVLVIMTCVLCSVPLSASGQAPALTTIRVGMIPIEPAATIYYARANGFFTKVGLEVEIQQNTSTPALAAAVASGTLDISYATIPTLAVAHTKNLPFVIIAPGISDSPQHFGGAIMVPLNSTAKTGKDLNGKTIGAASLNTIAEYLPRAWIDKNGGDSSTVKFLEIPFPSLPEALGTGRVDGAYMPEPFYTIAKQKHVARELATGDDAIANEYLATAWFTTTTWAKAHPDLVARFQRAMSEAAIWANANQAKTLPILIKELKVDPVLAAQTRRPYFAEKIVSSQIQPYIDVVAKYAKYQTFRAEELIYAAGR